LKHVRGAAEMFMTWVALRAGAWIETLQRLRFYRLSGVALRAGAWIETSRAAVVLAISHVALRAGAWIETPYSLESMSWQVGRPPCGGVD